MISVVRSQSTTLWRAYCLPFLVLSSCLSYQLEAWVTGQGKILESWTGWNDASPWWFSSYQCFLSFTEHFNSITIHSLILPLVTPLIFSYILLVTFSNYDIKAPLISSSCASFQHQEKETIDPPWGSPWPSQHDTGIWQCSSRFQFRICWRWCSVTIPEHNEQVAVTGYLHVITWNTGCGNSDNFYFDATPTFWLLGGLSCLGRGGWTRACSAVIQEGIRSSVQSVEFARWCISLLEEAFRPSLWAIGGIESWESVAIWARCWCHDRPHCQSWMTHPENSFRHSSDGHGMCEAYSAQWCNVAESL